MNEHVDVICEQFEFVINKLIEEGYSAFDVLKALSIMMVDLADIFEEIDDE